MSGFLLDTNVPSEAGRSRPTPRVTAWVRGQDNSTLFLSAVSIVLLWFGERILPVTKEIADRWGTLDANCQLRGTPANTADGMIAATALEHGLTVVTRNVKDFTRLGVTVFNPWDAEPEPA